MLACMLFATLPALADWVAVYRMGEALLDEGRPHEAIGELKRALEQRPDHAAILDALGRAEFHAGQY